MRRHARIIAAVIVLGAPMAATARQQDPAKAQSVLTDTRAAIGGRKLDSLRSLGLEATVQRNMGNIQLSSDGSASCISTDGMPSVASVANLLLTLLPPGTPNVPGPLRYAIARGLEAVEAPPFKSLAEFSKVLERFEKGASRDVLRGVLQRGARPIAIAVAPTPATPPAAGSSPLALRPTVVPPRPTLVVSNRQRP